ncbi:MAG: membrane protein insertion efficiency factor YidD [Ruminococcus sp.]|nr:membrane protein insertion efficiency factor YidD [Ruminococcus sp.]
MKFILISLVKLYKKLISPLSAPKCKFYPSCSSYAIDALQKFGAIRGSALAVWRILRCNPWSLGGIDYVPERFTFKVKNVGDLADLPDEWPYEDNSKDDTNN